MKQRYTIRPLPSGFSLIELVIALIVLGFLGIIGAKMIANSVYATQMTTQNHLAYSKARFAMNRISSEIREVQFVNSAPNITTNWQAPPTNSISFVKTNLTGNPTSTVSFNYSNSSLTMQLDSLPSPAATLVDNLSNFSLTYLKANGTDVADSWLTTCFVRISMTIAPSDAPAQTLVNTVALRNY